MKKIIIIICISTSLLTKAFSQTIFVNGSLPTNGNGTSWAMAFNNLQDAIEISNSTNEIWLAKGIYLPTKDSTGSSSPTDNRKKTFYINKNIKLYGGFSGNEASLSAANPAVNETIISGNLDLDNTNINDAYHVLVFSTHALLGGINNSTVINGLTISNGNANLTGTNAGGNNFGGGIYFNAIGNGKTMSPVFENILFKMNNAQSGGACYFNILGTTVSPLFSRCSFKSNSAVGAGGAIRFNIYGVLSPTIEGCLFELNTAGSGGAIYNINYDGSSHIAVSNTYFIKNSSSGSGGVIYSCSNGTNVINSPSFSNTIFSENMSVSTGGCIYNIANQGETSSIVMNCTFSKNTSANGAAMYSRKAAGAICNPTVTNSIFWDATTANNEVTNNPTALSSTTITNCIYTDGTIDGMINPAVGNTFVNCMEADPKLKDANDLDGADNIIKTTDDGLSLLLDSPAINFNPMPVATSSIKNGKITASKDITGITDRIIGGLVDLGPYEFIANNPLPLQLLNFSAKKSKTFIELNWETSNEINTQSIDIERSTNAKVFEKIGTKQTHNNFEKQVYSFIDQDISLQKEIFYYRLKLNDLDKSFTYSKIIAVAPENETKISFWPNPAKDYAFINFENGQNDTYKIFDISGKLVMDLLESPFELLSNNKQLKLNLNRLEKGAYLLKINELQAIKFLIEK